LSIFVQVGFVPSPLQEEIRIKFSKRMLKMIDIRNNDIVEALIDICNYSDIRLIMKRKVKLDKNIVFGFDSADYALSSLQDFLCKEDDKEFKAVVEEKGKVGNEIWMFKVGAVCARFGIVV
jgi:hypothetical protein